MFTILLKAPSPSTGINTPPKIEDADIIIEQSGPDCFSFFAIVPIRIPIEIKSIIEGIKYTVATNILKEKLSPKRVATNKNNSVCAKNMGKAHSA